VERLDRLAGPTEAEVAGADDAECVDDLMEQPVVLTAGDQKVVDARPAPGGDRQRRQLDRLRPRPGNRQEADQIPGTPSVRAASVSRSRSPGLAATPSR
jgi:hypothetical protein